MQNCFLDGNYSLKLADFGLMKIFEDEEGEVELKTKLGTDGYMAPEIKNSESYSGPPIDIFAAGVVLFMMLTCNQPFLHGGDEFHLSILTKP